MYRYFERWLCLCKLSTELLNFMFTIDLLSSLKFKLNQNNCNTKYINNVYYSCEYISSIIMNIIFHNRFTLSLALKLFVD